MTTLATTTIPGYTFDAPDLPKSPLTQAEFDLLRQTVLFTDDDVRYLRMAGDVLADQIEAILDVWYGFVGAHPHLLAYFSTHDSQPIGDYLARVRQRFGQWILDTTRRPYDQQWLDYQMEIGLRHHVTKKNVTDHANAPAIIPLRYMVAFIYPITATIKPFLAQKGHAPTEVEAMFNAWFKAVTLQVILWVQPYVNEGEF